MDRKFAPDRPVYRQIMMLLRGQILRNELPPGSRVPSVRELSAQAQVDPNTVQRAMNELEREGLLVGGGTSGSGKTTFLKLAAGILGGFALRSMILLTEQEDPSAFQTVITMFTIMVSFVSMMLYSPVAMITEVIILMLSVTIGSVVARKLKVLASIGVYYGINVVLSLANSVIMVLSGLLSSNSIDFYDQLFLYPTVLMLILGVGGYFLMHRLASKKPDLP